MREKNPGLSQGKAASTHLETVAKCDHQVEPEEHFVCQLYRRFLLKVYVPEINGQMDVR